MAEPNHPLVRWVKNVFDGTRSISCAGLFVVFGELSGSYRVLYGIMVPVLPAGSTSSKYHNNNNTIQYHQYLYV